MDKHWIYLKINHCAPAITRHPPNVESTLGQRRERWANVDSILGECLVFAGAAFSPLFTYPRHTARSFHCRAEPKSSRPICKTHWCKTHWSTRRSARHRVGLQRHDFDHFQNIPARRRGRALWATR